MGQRRVPPALNPLLGAPSKHLSGNPRRTPAAAVDHVAKARGVQQRVWPAHNGREQGACVAWQPHMVCAGVHAARLVLAPMPCTSAQHGPWAPHPMHAGRKREAGVQRSASGRKVLPGGLIAQPLGKKGGGGGLDARREDDGSHRGEGAKWARRGRGGGEHGSTPRRGGTWSADEE